MENTGEKPRQPSATGGRQETGTYGASEAVLKAAKRGRKAKDAPHKYPGLRKRAEERANRVAATKEEPPKEDTPKEDTPGRTAADVEREAPCGGQSWTANGGGKLCGECEPNYHAKDYDQCYACDRGSDPGAGKQW